jgi:hypothetical protein
MTEAGAKNSRLFYSKIGGDTRELLPLPTVIQANPYFTQEVIMSNAAKSILAYGIYLVGLGGVLLVAPDLPLPFFGIALAKDFWIRILGMTVLFLGYYFIRAGRSDVKPFFEWTLYPRGTIFFVFGALVLLGLAPINLLLFTPPDILFTVWTFLALRADKMRMQPAHA